jgi:hypothetical protein
MENTKENRLNLATYMVDGMDIDDIIADLVNQLMEEMEDTDVFDVNVEDHEFDQ